ncbi:hypothetical protein HBI56_194240 [Parastagonospora nodorum]|nr:hypothetical protein HBI56_194240 [Parastagonospora nodorum]
MRSQRGGVQQGSGWAPSQVGAQRRHHWRASPQFAAHLSCSKPATQSPADLNCVAKEPHTLSTSSNLSDHDSGGGYPCPRSPKEGRRSHTLEDFSVTGQPPSAGILILEH